MEPESSLFETSEVVSNFLASTNLLVDCWRLCCSTPSPVSGPGVFVVDHIGPVGFLGFSAQLGVSQNHMVRLKAADKDGLFFALDYHGENDEDRIMVHAGFLELFLGFYGRPSFQTKIKTIIDKSKSIILTGHSIGGAIASLTTLYLLCQLQSIPSPPQVLCITFGSPLLGNESLSKSLLRERWAANYCHVVLQHDIIPRLLFAPLNSNVNMTSMTDEEKNQLFGYVMAHTEAAGSAGVSSESLWPFGNYLFCSEKGAICVDNAGSVVKLLYLMLATGDSKSCFEDHLKYGDYAERLCFEVLMRGGFKQGNLPMSSYEAGLALALESSGFVCQESVYKEAKDCLKKAKQMGLTPNLNSARLAIKLSKITPHRAQIEWYKSSCDELDNHMGYYDSFKQRQASKKDSQVNMFRIRLASFWDNVINMIDNNELPPDFNKRRKWVNTSHFYQLLVEPLDIAEYYRSGEHVRKGHYLKSGRERRHELFDKWWRERYFVVPASKRSKFASLTQDSCFWARVEEARDLLEKVRTEGDSSKSTIIWQGIDAFKRYAEELIENKEVSIDVLAKNSSYSLWVEELKELRSKVQRIYLADA